MKNFIVDLRGFDYNYFGGVRRFAYDLPIVLNKKYNVLLIVNSKSFKDILISEGVSEESIFLDKRTLKKRNYVLFLFTAIDYLIKTYVFTQYYFRIFRKDSYQFIEGDICYVPTSTINYYSRIPKYIVSPHDLQHEVYPENFSKIVRIYRFSQYRLSLYISSKIQLSSITIKDEFINLIPDIANKIVILNEFYTDKKYNIDYNLIDKQILNLFYPAQFWEHKNHDQLFSILSKLPMKFKLHLTGNDFGKIKNYSHYEFLEYHGVVSEQKLISLYKLCDFTVLPTKYESSSLPMIESIGLGTPVIYNNIDVLREIGDTLPNCFPFDFKNGSVNELEELLLNLQFSDSKIPEKFEINHVAHKLFNLF